MLISKSQFRGHVPKGPGFGKMADTDDLFVLAFIRDKEAVAVLSSDKNNISLNFTTNRKLSTRHCRIYTLER